MPVPGEDGLPVWSADDRRPQVRTYTVRRLDLEAGTIDVDFMLNGDHGLGSRWALNARPGDVIGVRGSTGRRQPEVTWYLLVGDETALLVIAGLLVDWGSSSLVFPRQKPIFPSLNGGL
jgi:NADPH-dependent ferric siderophore reductase